MLIAKRRNKQFRVTPSLINLFFVNSSLVTPSLVTLSLVNSSLVNSSTKKSTCPPRHRQHPYTA